MPAPAVPQKWNFYEGSAPEGRVIVGINLGLRDEAPVSSHPVCVHVRVKMLQPREDGLRSSAEAEALFALEDKLTEALDRAADALQVARVVAFGYSDFVFYVPAAHREAAGRAETLLGGAAPYELEWFADDDPEWTEYQDLYPDAYSMQSIMNRELVDMMVKNGDQLEIPREVDHAAVFPTREQADAASRVLSEKGFRVGRLRQQDPARWFLEFHKVERCDGDEPDRFVFEVMDLIEPFDGEYDGWGSLMQHATS